MASEKLPQMIEVPEGKVKVELMDERGKVVQCEEGDNFIAQDTTAYMQWLQRAMWGWYIPNAGIDGTGASMRRPARWPATHLAYWNDATAEDSVNEHKIGAPLVGWASRWPQGSPTGMRGLVNITESEMTPAHAKWVFDWTTPCGNGTFQSVGWTTVDETANAPGVRPVDSVTSISDFNRFTATTSQSYNSYPHYFDGTNWYIADRVTAGSGNQYRISQYNSSMGGRSTLFSISTSEWQDSTIPMSGLAKLGTDYYTAGISTTSSGKPLVRKYNASGTLQWSRTESGDTNTFRYVDITSDGTNPWAIRQDGTIYKLSTSDGTRTTTVSITGSPITINGAEGIAYDASDGKFWVIVATANFPATSSSSVSSVILKVNSSGVVDTSVSPLAFVAGDTATGTVTSPWTGTYVLSPSGPSYNSVSTQNLGTAVYSMASVAHGFNTNLSGTEVNYQYYSNNGETHQYTLSYYNGTFYMIKTPTSTTAAMVQFTGHNLGTRYLLGAPVTKTSSQTLKITYQFNF